jgi:hypothetical protein
MDNNKIYSYLTNAAKEELELKTSEFRNNLLAEAYKSADRKHSEIKEISLTDLLDAKKSTINLIDSKNYSKSLYRKERWNGLLTISGITYTIIGIGIYLYQNGLIETKNSIGLIVATVGILVTLFAQSIKYPFFRFSGDLQKQQQKSNSKYTIVDRWGKIEQLGRKLIAENFPNVKTQSFGSIIKLLGNQLTEESYKDLRKLLEIRSKILHEDYNPSNSELEWSIIASDKIIEQIEKMN